MSEPASVASSISESWFRIESWITERATWHSSAMLTYGPMRESLIATPSPMLTYGPTILLVSLAGGGQSNDPSEISRREKEMIAATFKQQSDKKATQKQAAEMATFLAEAQATLRNQSLSLSGRLEARDLFVNRVE